MSIFSYLTAISLVSPKTILAVFGVVVAIYVTITIVLTYHWKKYSVTPEENRRMRNVYSFVSVFLWIIVIVSGIQSMSVL